MKNRAAKLNEIARTYKENHHWVSVRLNGKAPIGSEWQKRTLGDELPIFGNDDNIGIVCGKASGDLVRLDPDFPAMPGVTSILFPEPTAVFCRPSSPGTGRLVACATKSKNFKLPEIVKTDPRLPMHGSKPNLIAFQILSDGKQTMAPPSIHPETGEELAWQSTAPPHHIGEAELLRRCGLEAFCMAVRQFWPARGTRNEAAMALARVLLEAMASTVLNDADRIAMVDDLVLEIAMDGGDGEESRDGKARAAATLEKMQAGDYATGMPTLLELLELPEEVGTKAFRKWLGLSAPAAVSIAIDKTSNFPTIYCAAGEIPRIADEAEAALIEAGAAIYVHGSTLVQPVTETCEASHDRKTKVARLRPMTEVTMVEALSAAAVWARMTAKGWRRADPPASIAKTLLERPGRWKLHRVVGVLTSPTLRPDGSLIASPGYDPATQYLLVSPPAMPIIPEKPTKAAAQAALSRLDALLTEFPFVDDVARSVGLSALITPVARGAMIVAPGHVVSAPEAGTGKSYLIDVASAIATGRWCPVVAIGRTEEETEKRLDAILIKGQPLVSIDNVNGLLGGDKLCQMITAPTVEVRVLGLSKVVSIDNRVTVFANGNNIVVTGDLVRRVVRCEMDAGLERPEAREFKSNPVDVVLADRGQYVADALVVVRAYIAAGRPGVRGLPPFQGFADWSRTVRGALVWLGRSDPVESVKSAREDDPGRTTLVAVVEAIAELKLDRAVTTGELVSMAESVDGKDYTFPALRAALMEAVGDRGGISSKALGWWFNRHKGRVVVGYKIVRRAHRSHHQALWELEKRG